MGEQHINWSRKRYNQQRKSGQVIIELLTHEGARPKIHFLNFKESRFISPFRFKRQARGFVRALASKGIFNDSFSEDELKLASKSGKLPDSYMVGYKIPLELGGLNGPDNMCVVDRQVFELMDILYWHQVRMLANAFVYTNKGNGSAKMGILCRPIPVFFDQKAFLDFVLPDERSFLQNRLRFTKSERQEVEHITRTDYENGIVLSLSFPQEELDNMSMALVKVKPVAIEERNRIRSEYLEKRPDIVMASLKRGDFSFLGKQDLRDIERFKRAPASLSCHHIVPRELGGSNEMENLSWLPKREHELLHQNVLTPLTNYLFNMEDEGKPIFLSIPVPSDARVSKYFVKGNVVKHLDPKFRAKPLRTKSNDP